MFLRRSSVCGNCGACAAGSLSCGSSGADGADVDEKEEGAALVTILIAYRSVFVSFSALPFLHPSTFHSLSLTLRSPGVELLSAVDSCSLLLCLSLANLDAFATWFSLKTPPMRGGGFSPRSGVLGPECTGAQNFSRAGTPGDRLQLGHPPPFIYRFFCNIIGINIFMVNVNVHNSSNNQMGKFTPAVRP